MNDIKNLKTKKTKIKIKAVLFALIFIIFLLYLLISFIKKPISNIFISGNEILTDWEIIELAELDNYPSWFSVSTNLVEEKLKSNVLIKETKIKKKSGFKIKINIEENRPLFFETVRNKTILYDGREISGHYNTPIMSSSLTGELYVLFLEGMREVKDDVMNKISEIVYSPDEVDDERILLTMTDGNYVYLTLKKFNAINDYNNIVKEFDNKKGILYLNSGGYFKIMEN